MDVPLRKSHPQKHFMRIMCKSIYFLGMGDFWYEETKRSKTHKIVYAVYAVAVNGLLILNTLNELLANLRTDLTTKEKNDLLQFSMAHPALSAKFVFLILKKKKAKVLIERLVEGSASIFTSLEIEKQSVKKVIWYIATLAVVTYGTLFTATMDVFLTHKKEGIPLRIEVTLIPVPSQTGFFACILKYIVEFHWWLLVTNMLIVDGMAFTTLIFMSYKFRLVCMYFDELRIKTRSNLKTKDDKERAKEFQKSFITGIKLHEDALWCSRNVQICMGNIYGVQIIETITLLVVCLIKLVNLERSMMFLLASFFYIACLLTLNGAYMMAAGDVTYEAAQLSDSMFHSGWELVRTSRQFRTLAVLAIQSSHRPVHMTAFGVITLSHSNLISVIRSSYSFFAVMY